MYWNTCIKNFARCYDYNAHYELHDHRYFRWVVSAAHLSCSTCIFPIYHVKLLLITESQDSLLYRVWKEINKYAYVPFYIDFAIGFVQAWRLIKSTTGKSVLAPLFSCHHWCYVTGYMVKPLVNTWIYHDMIMQELSNHGCITRNNFEKKNNPWWTLHLVLAWFSSRFNSNFATGHNDINFTNTQHFVIYKKHFIPVILISSVYDNVVLYFTSYGYIMCMCSLLCNRRCSLFQIPLHVNTFSQSFRGVNDVKNVIASTIYYQRYFAKLPITWLYMSKSTQQHIGHLLGGEYPHVRH